MHHTETMNRRFVPSDAPPSPDDPAYQRDTGEMSLAEIAEALCDGEVTVDDA